MARPAGSGTAVAPIAAITLYGLATALSIPLFGLLMERMGVSGTAIGLSHAAAAAATVVFAPVMPVILARAGLVRLMLWSAGLAAAIFPLAWLWFDYWYWLVLRIAFGVAGTVLFFGSEYWIVAAAPDGRRGRAVAVYAVAISVAFLAGPLILTAVGIDGPAPFLAGAATALACALPIWLGRDAAPPADGERPSALAALTLFRTEPVILLGVVLFATIEFGVLGLIPVWGVRSGLAETDAVALLSLFALGAILFQWPIGLAADRADPVRLLALAAAVCIAAPLAMAGLGASLAGLGLAILVWGGLAAALYTLALTQAGARFRGTRLSEANAAIVLGYGFGAVAAPVAMGAALDAVPPDGMLWLSALLAAGYLGLVAAALRARPRKALDTGGGAGT